MAEPIVAGWAQNEATEKAAERRSRFEANQQEEQRQEAIHRMLTNPGDAITAPEKEWIVAGVENVRENFPPAEFLLGGVLDALEDYGWSGQTSPLGLGLAALDVADPSPLTAALLPIKREVKEKMAKEGYEMAFDEDYFPELGSAEFSLGVADPEGVQIGGITGEIYPETREVRIAMSELDPEFQGQGIGAAMYDQVMDVAERKGFDLTSDRSVSPAAQKMYERFGRKGYDVEVNPEAARMEAGDVGTLSTFNQPVYRVRPGERAPVGGFEETEYFHGTPAEFDEFADRPTFVSNDPMVAEEYTGESGRMIPLQTREGRYASSDEVMQIAQEMGIDTSKAWDATEYFDENLSYNQDLIDELRRRGFLGVDDVSTGEHQRVVFDPNRDIKTIADYMGIQ